MIGEILAQHAWLWPLAWQSTAVLVLGLVGSFILRRRAVRAHQLLLLALVAAIAVPTLSLLVKRHHWGLLTARPAAIEIESCSFIALGAPAITESTPRTNTAPITASEAATRTLPLASTTPAIEWTRLVLPLWIALSATLLVRLVIRFLLGYRLARRSEPFGTDEITRAIESTKTKLGIEGDVLLCRSGDTHSPVIWCWGPCPLLLIPAKTDANGDIDWQSVVCHELAHWKRRDHLSGLWAELMLCALPWNPLSWLAQRRLTHLSEQACDDWVIASGQIGTRYARTLLGLIPQGRAALVPAVVSSKKGLATRVRRILADQCANPHSGLRWSLAAATFASCLAVGIAFAQTRPAEPTGTTKTTLGHGAVVEQLAPTMTIRGVLLDPNGNPTNNAYIIAPPMTTFGAKGQDDGHFELPWSPTWFEKGQPFYLVAIGPGHENQAALVEVTNPNLPVTVRLEPAFALEATVVDPNGQRVPGYTAVLSLATEYKCPAPIWATDVAPPRVGLFSSIPFGPQYTLTIIAKGYQTKRTVIDGANRGKRVRDLGTLVLERENTASPTTRATEVNTKLRETFLGLYRLDKDQTVKLVKTPFVLGRQEWLYEPTRFPELPVGYGGGLQWRFGWNGELQKPRYGFSGRANLDNILRLMLVMPKHDFNLPRELNVRLPDGDWIVRTGAPLEDQVKALERIVCTEVGRPIRFEKRRIQREVVVVRGRYQLTSHPNGKHPNYVHLSWDGTVGNREERADSLTDIFERLERDIAMKIVDETEFRPEAAIPFVATNNLAWIGDVADVKSEHLDDLLDNLAKTTSLQFTVEKRPAEIWVVTEEEAK